MNHLKKALAICLFLTACTSGSGKTETDEDRVLVGRTGESCTFADTQTVECADGVRYNCRDIAEDEEQAKYEVIEFRCTETDPDFECNLAGDREVCSYGENEAEVCDNNVATECVEDEWSPVCQAFTIDSEGWIGGKNPCPEDAPCSGGRCTPPEDEAELSCDGANPNDRNATCWRDYIWSCNATSIGRFFDCKTLDPDATCLQARCVQSLEPDERCSEGVPGVCVSEFQVAPCVDGRLGVVQDCPDEACRDGECPPLVDNEG